MSQLELGPDGDERSVERPSAARKPSGRACYYCSRPINSSTSSTVFVYRIIAGDPIGKELVPVHGSCYVAMHRDVKLPPVKP